MTIFCPKVSSPAGWSKRRAAATALRLSQPWLTLFHWFGHKATALVPRSSDSTPVFHLPGFHLAEGNGSWALAAPEQGPQKASLEQRQPMNHQCRIHIPPEVSPRAPTPQLLLPRPHLTTSLRNTFNSPSFHSCGMANAAFPSCGSLLCESQSRSLCSGVFVLCLGQSVCLRPRKFSSATA